MRLPANACRPRGSPDRCWKHRPGPRPITSTKGERSWEPPCPRAPRRCRSTRRDLARDCLRAGRRTYVGLQQVDGSDGAPDRAVPPLARGFEPTDSPPPLDPDPDTSPHVGVRAVSAVTNSVAAVGHSRQSGSQFYSPQTVVRSSSDMNMPMSSTPSARQA